MFTIEKGKLFFNDPKFRQIEQWTPDQQEHAVNKIFAGQQQLRRSKVAQKTIENSSKQGLPSQLLLVDFLQSRMNAYEEKLVDNVEEMFSEKERIKEKYSEAESLYEKANRKLKRLMHGVKTEQVKVDGIAQIEEEVAQIERLYEENQFLRKMNTDIKQRIEKKQLQLGGFRK